MYFLFISLSSIKLKARVLFQPQPSSVTPWFKDTFFRSKMVPHRLCEPGTSSWMHRTTYLLQLSTPRSSKFTCWQTQTANDETKHASRLLCLFTQDFRHLKEVRGMFFSLSLLLLVSKVQCGIIISSLSWFWTLWNVCFTRGLMTDNTTSLLTCVSVRRSMHVLMCETCASSDKRICEHDESRAKEC